MGQSNQGDNTKQSTLFFHTPSICIPDFLHYPICIGHFYCDRTYKVDRTSYDSYLLLYTRHGKGLLKVGSASQQLNTGDVCLINCYKPHFYQALDNWELEWLHFDGGNSSVFFQYLCSNEPFFHALLDNPTQFEETWKRLYDTLLKKSNTHELLLSQDIAQLLTLLGLSKNRCEKRHGITTFMDPSLEYIHRHLTEDLTLNELADRVSLSPFYYTRKFKEETGYTPYRYILISRINLAKFYLKSNLESVKNIGFDCGFHSEHSFCTMFKKEVGMTPSEYRNKARY